MLAHEKFNFFYFTDYGIVEKLQEVGKYHKFMIQPTWINWTESFMPYLQGPGDYNVDVVLTESPGGARKRT